jgi:hypothetical protein
VAIFCVVAFTGSQALAYLIDGNLDDWGITIVNDDDSLLIDPVSGITYWVEDDPDHWGDGGPVGPGYGGQNYDAEAICAALDDSWLYFAVASGARPDNGWERYEPGDIMITNSAGTMFALETTGYRYDLDGAGFVANDPTTVTSMQTGVAGHLYQVHGYYPEDSGSTLVMRGLTNWSLAADNQDPVQLYSVGASISNIEFVFNNDFNINGSPSQHSFMEGRISRTLLGGLDDNIVNVHWANACGNDGGSAATPEPSTALMFVVGSFALLGFCRKELFKRKN